MKWLNPVFLKDGTALPSQESAASHTILSAMSLGLITKSGNEYRLSDSHLPQSFLAFTDDVHTRLCEAPSDDPDRVLLEAYAWVVLKTDLDGGFSWFADWNTKELADAINYSLPARDQSDEGRRFNATKIPPWYGWLVAVGLFKDLANGDKYPYVTERLARVLADSGLAFDTELPAQKVLNVIAQRMPYLDNGALLKEATKRAGTVRPRHLSRVLSVALRDLDDEGRLVLRPVGDSSQNIPLAPDNFHKKNSIGLVTLKKDLAYV
jgi:hypothetical protein